MDNSDIRNEQFRIEDYYFYLVVDEMMMMMMMMMMITVSIITFYKAQILIWRRVDWFRSLQS